MTETRIRWANAEQVGKWVAAHYVTVGGAPVAHAGRETPIGPDAQVADGTVRVERTAGEVNRDRTEDAPLVEFASFAATYDQAQAMTQQIEGALADLVGELVGEGENRTCLNGARMENGPQRPQWGRDARRDVVTFRLFLKPIID